MTKITDTPLLSCITKHHVFGRVRISCNALLYLEKYSEEIKNSILTSSGIISVKINILTANFLIYFDESNFSRENIEELLDRIISTYSLPAYRGERTAKNTQLVVERKFDENSVSQNIKNIISTTLTLIYFIKKPAPLNISLISKIFNMRTFTILSLSKSVLSSGILSLIKTRRPNADTLSSSAILSSLLIGKEKSALSIILLENLSELLTAYTMQKTRNAIKDMLSIGEDFVLKEISDLELQRVSIKSIIKGDKIVVYPGDKISVDGYIIKGSALIDQASITGEFMPVNKSINEEVFAGTVVKTGTITIMAEKIGDDTAVSRIIKLVEDATYNKASIQSYADQFSAQLIPLNFLLGAIVYLGTKSFSRAMSMLVIDYSCGIRLSTATAFSAAISTAAKNGVLVKGSNFIESFSKTDTVILDKTGTLTEGKPKVTSITPIGNTTEKEILIFAGCAEETSNHPLALSILNKVKSMGYSLPQHTQCIIEVSKGVSTILGEDNIKAGSRKYLEENNISLTEYDDIIKNLTLRGETIIFVAKNNKLIGLIGVNDSLRENMKKSINRLRYLGVHDIILLTGDQRNQAEIVAGRMAMDRFESGLMPEDKAKNILQLQSKGACVTMIGDGVNDAPALAYSNVGVAMGGSRTDIAMESADITITGENPMMIPATLELSQNTMSRIKENFALSIGINSFALVLGAAGVLPALYGSIIHNASTLLVVGNSLRLLRFEMKK